MFEAQLSELSYILKLIPHPSARNTVVASKALKAGSIILSNPAFASILLHSQQRIRCDACFCRQIAGRRTLKRCSGCGLCWYCDAKCQDFHWNSGHKKICKMFNSYISSASYQALPQHIKFDSLLLSQLAAKISLLNSSDPTEIGEVAILLSLIPNSEIESPKLPPVCPMSPSVPGHILRDLFARFGNNNFSIHSHLNSIGHGVFPMASRLFNHSCMPNAAARYIFSSGRAPCMEIVALRDISEGEEICIPYVDPALLQSRQRILEITYGFQCDCSSCQFLRRSGTTLGNASDVPDVSDKLQIFVGLKGGSNSSLPYKSLDTTPPSLYCVLQESYMARLSETFSKGSHEGDYEVALRSGTTLLALYILVYPPCYPQIGMHLLEMAKTAWNLWTQSANLDSAESNRALEQARSSLSSAKAILLTYGSEGDEEGPLQEAAFLETLLSEALLLSKSASSVSLVPSSVASLNLLETEEEEDRSSAI